LDTATVITPCRAPNNECTACTTVTATAAAAIAAAVGVSTATAAAAAAVHGAADSVADGVSDCAGEAATATASDSISAATEHVSRLRYCAPQRSPQQRHACDESRCQYSTRGS
jgi:hypothetical protein